MGYILGLMIGLGIGLPFTLWLLGSQEKLDKARAEVKRKQEQRQSNNEKMEQWKKYCNETFHNPYASEREIVLSIGFLDHISVIEQTLEAHYRK